MFSSASDSLVRKGVQLNDFLDNSFNDATRGFLVAEYVPPPITGLPSKRRKFGGVSGSLLSNTDLFRKEGYTAPCVTIEGVDSKLPKCLSKRDDPIPLANSHCDDLYEQVMNDIDLYDQRIDSIPTKDISRRWPQPPMYCAWDCGQVFSSYLFYMIPYARP